MNDPVIEIDKLSRSFGAKVALDEISLRVLRGGVFGLMGENGAGKTTMIKHVLGLYRAEKGSIRVFRRDPAAEPVFVLPVRRRPSMRMQSPRVAANRFLSRPSEQQRRLKQVVRRFLLLRPDSAIQNKCWRSARVCESWCYAQVQCLPEL